MKKIFNLLDKQNEEMNVEKIQVVTDSLKKLVDKDPDYFPYTFDKLFFVTKFHKNSLNEKSFEDLIHIFGSFFTRDERKFLIEGNDENLNTLKNLNDGNIYGFSEKQIEFGLKNEKENDIITFLFYNNFDSYHSMKYVLKAILMNKSILDRMESVKLQRCKTLFDIFLDM